MVLEGLVSGYREGPFSSTFHRCLRAWQDLQLVTHMCITGYRMNFKNAPGLLLMMVLGAGLLAPGVALAEEVDSSIASCLAAWGKHPFGKNPRYKTLSTAVKVFGIGRDTIDAEVTNFPALILVNPGVNVAGGSTIQLLNPNGWYCLRTTVNVMGGFTIKAHCKAHLATSSGDVTVMGNNSESKSVTVMGSTQVERVGCE